MVPNEAFWATLDPYYATRVSPMGSSAQSEPNLGTSAGPGPMSSRLSSDFWHPDNPLFWFGCLAVATVVGMAASTGKVSAGARAHVGPVAADVGVTA